MDPKQTKKSHSSVDLAKIVLAVSIIISAGLVLGVAEYMGKNKSVATIATKPLISSLLKTISPIEDRTKNWKTYRNHKLGFLVKYPTELHVTDSSDYDNHILFNSYDDNSDISMAFGNLSAYDDERKRNITFEEMLNDFKKEILGKETDFDNIKEEFITIDNNKAVVLVVDKEIAGITDVTKVRAYTILTLYKNEVFIANCASNIDKGECEAIFKSMIFSFKFIEKSNPAFLGVYSRDAGGLSESEKIKLGLSKELNYGGLVISRDLVNYLDWKISNYEEIEEDGITNGSPAEIAGLKAGDVILEVNGEKVFKLANEIKYGYMPGDKIKLKIFRNGEEQEIYVILGEYPTN